MMLRQLMKAVFETGVNGCDVYKQLLTGSGLCCTGLLTSLFRGTIVKVQHIQQDTPFSECLMACSQSYRPRLPECRSAVQFVQVW